MGCAGSWAGTPRRRPQRLGCASSDLSSVGSTTPRAIPARLIPSSAPRRVRARPDAYTRIDGPPRRRAGRHARGAGGDRRGARPVIGAPRSGWAGGVRDPAVDGHVAHGGHEARERRDLLLPGARGGGRGGSAGSAAAPSTTSRSGSRSRRPRPTASRRSMPCSRRRRGRRSWPTCATTSRAGSRARSGSARTWSAGTDRPARRPRTAPRRWMRSPCLGQCERAPAVMVTSAGRRSRRRTCGATSTAATTCSRCWRRPRVPGHEHRRGRSGDLAPQAGDPSLRLLTRVGRVDPRSLDAYRDDGGYEALRAAIEMGPDAVIERGHGVEAGRTRRGRVPDRPQVGRGRRSSPRRRGTSCATPTSPSRARSRTA